MGFVRRAIGWCGLLCCAFGWWFVGVWSALAIYFTGPGSKWFTGALAIAVLWLFWQGRREPLRLWQWFRKNWSEKRWTTSALAAAIAIVIYYFGFITPDVNVEWSPEQARHPIVEIDGDKIHVQNVRNFTWRSRTDFTPGFYDRTYDLSKLNSMYYVVAPMPGLDAVAHVFVCFGFSDGQTVAVSVEGRRRLGQPYQLIPSMFRQLQLMYVVGDERDVVGLRGKIWQVPVFFYPANTTPERMRAIFQSMMEGAHQLEEKPEFYNLIWNNCMTRILMHLRRLGGHSLPHDLQVLLTGLSDRIAFRLGYIDTDLTFEQARRAFRVDPWMQTTPLDETFGQRLRETIERQEAEEREGAANGATNDQ
jgi:hypothetical protein